MRPLLPALLLLCAAVAPVGAAGAAARTAGAGGPRLEGVPGVLRSGQVVEIRWRGLAAGVREVELELSVGGGRWLRISPELEALEGAFLWRVPEGLSGDARLRLRTGGRDGEREAVVLDLELIGGAYEPGFAFASPGGWSRCGTVGAAPGASLGGARASWSPGADLSAVVGVPGVGLTPDAKQRPGAITPARVALDAPRETRAFAPPRRLPLRI